MLRTTPESLHENLPFEDKESRLVITADSRIDNRQALTKQLGIGSDLAVDLPDSQIILQAYLKWGTECPKYLLGDFSFAIWDSQNQRLFCAVDYFNVRPLYYHFSDNRFIFASEISGLLPGRLVPGQVNKTRLVALFLPELGTLNRASTLYEQVLTLPAAHCLVVSDNGLSSWRYWNPQDLELTHHKTDELYIEECGELLKEATRCRLRSDTDTALALSGGIDSAMIAMYSRDLLRDSPANQIAISGVSSIARSCHETQKIFTAQSALSDNSRTFTTDVVSSDYSRLREIIGRYDYPLGINSMFLMALYSYASQNGCKVMLDGAEGDTVLGLRYGNIITSLIKASRIGEAIRESQLYRKNSLENDCPLSSIIVPRFRKALYRGKLHKKLFSLKCSLFGSRYAKSVPLRKAFAKNIPLKKLRMGAYEKSGRALRVSLEEEHISLFESGFIGRMYMGMDAMSSQFPLELRHPYLDRRLVEFALRLPWRLKNRDGWEKWVLRRAGTPAIPHAICWNKGSYQVGQAYLDKFLELSSEEISQVIHDRNSRIYQLLDYKLIQSMYKNFQNGNPSNFRATVTSIFALEIWLKRQCGF